MDRPCWHNYQSLSRISDLFCYVLSSFLSSASTKNNKKFEVFVFLDLCCFSYPSFDDKSQKTRKSFRRKLIFQRSTSQVLWLIPVIKRCLCPDERHPHSRPFGSLGSSVQIIWIITSISYLQPNSIRWSKYAAFLHQFFSFIFAKWRFQISPAFSNRRCLNSTDWLLVMSGAVKSLFSSRKYSTELTYNDVYTSSTISVFYFLHCLCFLRIWISFSFS